MIDKSIILIWVLALVHSSSIAKSVSPADDEVAAFLRSNRMLSLLEVQLEDRINSARNKDEKSELVEELSQLYLDQLRSLSRDDPYRQLVVLRARSLITRMDSIPMHELRIELHIEGYLELEPRVELARLGLLDASLQEEAIADFMLIKRDLNAVASQLEIKVNQTVKLANRVDSSEASGIQSQLADLRKFRSLSHYYHAWTGYSLSVLRGIHVSPDVFTSFGWLLGAEGEMPQFSQLNETTLEFEHVARSAIGVAMAFSQSEDHGSARSWAELVVESGYAENDSKEAAEDRLLQIMAAERDWVDAFQYAYLLKNKRGDDHLMRVADARYLAIQSLDALSSSRIGKGGESQATKVAQFAIEQLIANAEIGHILDLYKRYDRLPIVADSFVTSYATALSELNKAEASGRAGMYSSVATLFARALNADDASRFPKERTDCSLKLAYSEIRAGRPNEAINVCDRLIDTTSDSASIEEARWMRIAAIDSVNRGAQQTSSLLLEEAVREYIIAYPSTQRSAQLILRHAMQGTIDPRVAIETLSSISDDDPISIQARRTLIQLQYQQIRARGFSDQQQIAEQILLIGWLIQNDNGAIEDLAEASSRLGWVRIGLDLALRSDPSDLAIADELIELGMGLLAFDSSMGVYRSEFAFRRIELALQSNRADDAFELLEQLKVLDPDRARSAEVLVLNHLVLSWRERQTLRIARQVSDLGSQVLSLIMPSQGELLGLQASGIAEIIAECSEYIWQSEQDTSSLQLAQRVSVLVLDRGQPSEQGLRRTTRLTKEGGDLKNELEAWLRLLSAYPLDDDRWYEARYESLRVMKMLDPVRASGVYAQYKLLHPTLGPEPFNQLLADLFGETMPVQIDGKTSGDQP
jgi:tetratricopeptide (TPR) repeat protein